MLHARIWGSRGRLGWLRRWPSWVGLFLLVLLTGSRSARGDSDKASELSKSAESKPTTDAVIVTSESLKRMDVPTLAALLGDLDRKIAFLNSEAERQTYDAPFIRAFIAQRRDVVSSLRASQNAAKVLSCDDVGKRGEIRRFLAQLQQGQNGLGGERPVAEDDELVRLERAERSVAQELSVMRDVQSASENDGPPAPAAPVKGQVPADKAAPPKGDAVTGCSVVVEALKSGRFDALLGELEAAVASTQDGKRIKSREGVLSQLRETTKTRAEVLDELNARGSAGVAIAKLPLVVVFLGVFSLAIMVMVQRFRPEVQAMWVSSGQVVQFMTVTVLIIVVLVLGLASTLEGETVGTLIGSIGGYVLSQGIGRFVNRDRKEVSASSETSRPVNGGSGGGTSGSAGGLAGPVAAPSQSALDSTSSTASSTHGASLRPPPTPSIPPARPSTPTSGRGTE